MADREANEWAELRESILETPGARAEYERTRQTVLHTRGLLQQLDADEYRRRVPRSLA